MERKKRDKQKEIKKGFIERTAKTKKRLKDVYQSEKFAHFNIVFWEKPFGGQNFVLTMTVMTIKMKIRDLFKIMNKIIKAVILGKIAKLYWRVLSFYYFLSKAERKTVF